METRHLIQILLISLLNLLSITGNQAGHPRSADGKYIIPNQTLGTSDGQGSVSICQIVCQQYEAGFIPCPLHRKEDNDYMIKHMETCLEQEDADVSSCTFFPLQPPVPQERGIWSCHHTIKANVACMLGFKIRHTRQQRRTGADDSYINVEFYAKIPPIPDTPNNSDYNVAQWVALGISPRDRFMGDDLVIYCHPYMDRSIFKSNESQSLYPDDIGVAINKYFKEGSGKQVYDAERKFNKQLGKIRNGHVRYIEFNQTDDDPRWGILECQASISSYILLKSKTELSTGIDLDMELVKRAYVFMAMGSCLHPKCIGDHPDNTEELALIARRTTPLAFHNKYWISNDTIKLYEAIERTAGVKLETNITAVVIMLMYYLITM